MAIDGPGEVVTDRTTIHEALEGYRRRIRRVEPEQLASTPEAIVVDTREEQDRRAEGVIPGSIAIPLSVLLWRADPASPWRDDRISDLDAPLVVVCNDGYSSSWAASTLVDLGFRRAGDLSGGHRAWIAAGLPVDPGP